MSTVVLAFGRFSPPTQGHEKLANKIKDVAKREKATPQLYLSHSHDKLKNPLPYNEKYRYTKKAFGPMVQKSKARTIIEVLKELDGKFDHVIVVAGGDRISEFQNLLQKYNGKDYTFVSIRVENAGDRDPDAEDVTGMSASKLRAAATEGDLELFTKGIPSKLKNDAKRIFDIIRRNMGIREETLLEVLNMQQRRARKMMMRRIKSKIARGRRIARKRMAKPEKIKSRAQKAAKQLIRKKVAGKRAEKYNELPVSAKIQIDKQVEKRKGMISKIAKRMIPKVRKAERERLAKARKSKNESFDYNDIARVVTLAHTQDLVEQVEKNLRKKAEKHGIEFEDIREAYLSFKAYHNMDEQKTFQTINTILAKGNDHELD